MTKKAEQQVFPGDGFEQNQIRRVENLADKFDAARQLVGSATKDMNNAEFKLMEELFARLKTGEVTAEKDRLGAEQIAYTRGDYKIVVKGGTLHAKVKIKGASKPPSLEAPEPRDESDEAEADE